MAAHKCSFLSTAQRLQNRAQRQHEVAMAAGQHWDVSTASTPCDLPSGGLDGLYLDSCGDAGNEEDYSRKEGKGEKGQVAESHSCYLGPFFAQQHNDAQEACRCGIAQRSQAAFRRGIHVGPKLQQQGHHFCVTKMRLDTENWSII